MPEKIRILVIDDHPVVRDGLVAILSTQPDFEIIGEAGSGQEAIDKAAALQPDILLLDLQLPDLDGVQVLQNLRQRYPQIQAIVFTAFDTDERILGALQAGAQGYLLKGAPREELFQAVRVVSQGGSLLQPVVASRLLRHVRQESAPPPSSLTGREQEVLTQLALGRSNKEIAAALYITERTVKFHVSSILKKLDASNRTEAVTLAAQLGYITL